jgi:F-type H+-transporting ATPase subunit b
MIEKRKELVLKEVTEIKEIKEKNIEIEKEIQSKEIASKIKVDKIISSANEKAHNHKKNVEKEAKENSQRILDETDVMVAKKIRDSEKDIKDKIIDIAFATAEELSKKNISKIDNEKLVNEFINSLDKELSDEK